MIEFRPRRTPPQIPVGIDSNNPLTVGLRSAVVPNVADGIGYDAVLQFGTFPSAAAVPASVLVDDLSFKSFTQYAEGFSWVHRLDRTAASAVLTVPFFERAASTSYSAFLLVRHRNLVNASPEGYCSTQGATSTGLSFDGYGAAGTAPNRTVKLAVTHQGVAAYQSTVAIAADNIWIAVGFSDTASANVRFFANGSFLQQITTGAINATAGSLGWFAAAGATEPANYDCAIALFWDRRLADYEHALLAENPWQVFAPVPVILGLLSPKIPAAFQVAWAASANSVVQPGITIQ